MVDENLMSSAEVASLLGMTLNNLRQKQHRKQLCWTQKVGRKVFYKREDVEEYLRNRNNG